MKAEFDKELIKKYDRPGPRYTSYPPATEFTEEVGRREYVMKLTESNERKTPLSLYFHIPFCEQRCLYCGCNVIISHRRGIEEPYLERVKKEMSLVSRFINKDRKVVQLHWGGGTPNYLSPAQIKEFFNSIREHFDIDPSAEISIELDPRYLTDEQIEAIKEAGFNRVSLGVQDLNPKVQEAVGRIQPYELVKEKMEKLRSAGFDSINVDLIYGLPYQSAESFKETLEKIVELSPDRVATYSFAYIPQIKPHQQLLPKDALPSAEEKLRILETIINTFQSAGYVYIGMDHFAKPEDELAKAQQKGELWRNFQGYTTKKGVELLGFGATSIGMLYDSYFQNYKTLREYNTSLDKNEIPVFRGYIMTPDDLIRREVIMDIMCNLGVDFNKIEKTFNINFKEYFSRELEELAGMEKDGLIKILPGAIKILPPGRLLIRNVAMVFDAHLRKKKELRFSRTI
ncbi:MAG: oxygen-independent coproporphyrinogen III oxidase [Aquificae bacterium]|nr:oxygen-independent coproporphyrinogen III oxidase [Aquificota bacterium]